MVPEDAPAAGRPDARVAPGAETLADVVALAIDWVLR